MERFYSIILLLSLMVGTVQPILPMIEYQMHEGGIIELLDLGEESIKTDCTMSICTMEDCETQQSEADQSLLDLDYYPLALKITAIPTPKVFLSSTRFYLPSVKNVIDPVFLPNSPPPRLS